MRFKLTTLAVTIAALAIFFYFTWPAQNEKTVQVETRDVLPSLDKPTQSIAQQVAVTSGNMNTADNFIKGIIIDNDEIPIANSDILHQIIDNPQKLPCIDLNDIEFELSDTTELLLSDEQGMFSLPIDSALQTDNQDYCLIVNVSKQGYLTTIVALSGEKIPDLIEIDLNRNRSLSGVVFDPSGQRAAKSSIKIWARDDQTELEKNGICNNIDHESSLSTVSSQQGRFDIDAVEEMDYCIQAFHAAWSSSEPQIITSGNLTSSLELQLRNSSRFSGKVVDTDGSAVVDFQIQLEGQSLGGLANTYLSLTNRNGEFDFIGLSNDDYQLNSASPLYQIATPEHLVIESDQVLEDVVVTVYPLTMISGRVFDSQGQALEGVEVSARSRYTAEQTRSKTHSRTSSDSQGYFELNSRHQSAAAADAARMVAAYVDSSGLGSDVSSTDACIDFYHADFRSKTMSLSSSTSSLDLGNIELSPPIIQIGGRVLNHQGQPIVATLVFETLAVIEDATRQIRLPRCEDSSLRREIKTDANGNFAIQLDLEGQYAIQVISDNYQTRQIDMDFSGSTNDVEIKLR